RRVVGSTEARQKSAGQICIWLRHNMRMYLRPQLGAPGSVPRTLPPKLAGDAMQNWHPGRAQTPDNHQCYLQAGGWIRLRLENMRLRSLTFQNSTPHLAGNQLVH